MKYYVMTPCLYHGQGEAFWNSEICWVDTVKGATPYKMQQEKDFADHLRHEMPYPIQINVINSVGRLCFPDGTPVRNP